MKCFNHVDREAVATCQSCGKGLCRECASKYRPCLGTFDTGDYIGMGLFYFCVPFGWKGITYIESLIPTPRFFTFLVSWYFVVCWVTVKFMLALILGIPLFLFQLIKWAVNVSKIANAKNIN